MLNLDFNEIMVCILGVIFFIFRITMKEFDKNYNTFSEKEREEAKAIIEKSLENKIGKGVCIAGILALGISVYIKGGSDLNVPLGRETVVFISQIYNVSFRA